MTKLAVLISTGLGIGYAPGAPGTFASAAALPVGYIIVLYGGTGALFAIAFLASVVGIWASGLHAQSIGKIDPGTSVIDEIAGQLLAMLPLVPIGFVNDAAGIAAAFVLFRFFDIVKPWPISRLERFHGGIGIMADDIAAGLISAALLFSAIEIGWL